LSFAIPSALIVISRPAPPCVSLISFIFSSLLAAVRHKEDDALHTATWFEFSTW
jgi:hypothetical protein